MVIEINWFFDLVFVDVYALYLPYIHYLPFLWLELPYRIFVSLWWKRTTNKNLSKFHKREAWDITSSRSFNSNCFVSLFQAILWTILPMFLRLQIHGWDSLVWEWILFLTRRVRNYNKPKSTYPSISGKKTDFWGYFILKSLLKVSPRSRVYILYFIARCVQNKH